MRYSFEADVNRLIAIAEPHLADGFTFVSAGASDGIVADPVFPLLERWGGTGVAVEPVPYIFDQLVENYSHLPGALCLPVAIAEQRGVIELWYLEPGHGGLEHIVQSLGSSGRERLLDTISQLREMGDQVPSDPHVHPAHRPTSLSLGGTGIPADLERFVRSMEVEALTFDDLALRGRLDHVDLVNIDVEGKNFDIFRSIDWKRWNTKVLVLETFDMTDDERSAATEQMEALGYRPDGSFGLFSTVFLLQDPL